MKREPKGVLLVNPNRYKEPPVPPLALEYLVDALLANVCKLNVTRFPYEIARLAQDIAGGLLVTLPSEKDLAHPEMGPTLEKYLHGVDGYTTGERCRMLRLLENLTLGPGAAAYLTARRFRKQCGPRR